MEFPVTVWYIIAISFAIWGIPNVALRILKWFCDKHVFAFFVDFVNSQSDAVHCLDV